MPAKSNLIDFTAKAIKVHGNKYTYLNFDYKSGQIKSFITCKLHGDFLQTPNGHLVGGGCPSCGKRKRKTTASFIREAELMHGNNYEYSKVAYLGIKKQVIITCKTHGDFQQRADQHLNGNGCQKCAVLKRSKGNLHTTESFICKAMSIHGNLYDYSLSKYINMDKALVITCKEHGAFKISPRSHFNGVGCKKCGKRGFDKNLDSFVYIASSKCGTFDKIGITNDPRTRLSMLKIQTPFPLTMTYLFHCKNACDIETKIKSKFKNAGLTGFNACTEWFYSKEVDLLEAIKQMVEFDFKS